MRSEAAHLVCASAEPGAVWLAAAAARGLLRGAHRQRHGGAVWRRASKRRACSAGRVGVQRRCSQQSSASVLRCALSSIASPALDRWACLCDSASQVSPPPRTGHTATYSQGKLVVYGGRNAAGELLRSVWVFDTRAHLRGPMPLTRRVLTLAAARSGHRMA